ncbi:DUF5304 family protein, partial [Streptomyces alkaliphilus]|uniref:DUF5304 family protein n=1 Tax=Streptomyces alkaliphilus TaxID=1472722 RepID=UPI0018877761
LPGPPWADSYEVVLDTTLEDQSRAPGVEHAPGESLTLPPRSVLLLRALRAAEPGRVVQPAASDGIGRLGGDAARVARGARFALDPVIERNAPALDHLTRAGGELAAALRGFLDPGPSVNTPPRADDARATGPETGAEPAREAPGTGRGEGDDGDSPPSNPRRPDDQE